MIKPRIPSFVGSWLYPKAALHVAMEQNVSKNVNGFQYAVLRHINGTIIFTSF